MTKSELYGFIVFPLPVVRTKEKDFVTVLKESLAAYVNAVKRLDSKEVVDKNLVLHSIEKTNNYILSAVENTSKE